MALSAVITVIGKLADPALQRALRLYGVSVELEHMERALNQIEAFFKDADTKRNSEAQVKAWRNDLRKVAYRIEDAMDTFLMEIEGNRSRGSGMISKCMMCFKKPLKHYYLSVEIEDITKMLRTHFELANSLGINIAGDIYVGRNIGLPFRRENPSGFDDSEVVVGLEFNKRRIMRQLLDQTILRRTVLSIVGVGGLGKTTLAQEVYKSAELKVKFQCVIWLSISQKFDIMKLWRKILYEVKPSMKEGNIPSDEDLQKELERSLSDKRYLIILDDVWTVDLWEQLKEALPASQNASRVLITTTFLDVARKADNETKEHELCFLNEADSLALLFSKVFQAKIQPQKYPHLIDVAKQLTKKCSGLPLALCVLGGTQLLGARWRTHSICIGKRKSKCGEF